MNSEQNLLVAVGGWAVAILIALFTFVVQWRKGGADETAVVLTKWKELVEAHQKQIEGLANEMGKMRSRIDELEDTVETQRAEITRLNQELDGERRQSAQQSASFREQLRRLGKNDLGEANNDR
jgi:peptidoglycan hydrolase CwlO-like protein